MGMRLLIKKVNDVRDEIGGVVDEKVKGFRNLGSGTSKDWFCELCFCLLTANTSAKMGLRVQKELGYSGFTNFNSEDEIVGRLKNVGCRFYNRRGHFIYLANQFKDIKEILLQQGSKRKWLVDNIKGFGYKEASHFLRNIGFFDYAILDKHILALMYEYLIIDHVPKSLNRLTYVVYEESFKEIAEKIGMEMGELDLYMWYMKTGEVLK